MLKRIFSKAKSEEDGDSQRPAVETPGVDTVLDDTAIENNPRGNASSEKSLPLDLLGNHECIGEIVVDGEAGPSELMQAHALLKEIVKGDILYVSQGKKGTSIFCAIADPPSFLLALQRLPKVTSWDLTYR